MGYHIDAEHIQEMIVRGMVEPLPAAVSAAAERHIYASFPMESRASTRVIDWDRVPVANLHWSDATDDETEAWAQRTLAGRCRYGLLLYSSDEPCLIGEFSFMIRHLDELVWGAYGNRILLGVERDGPSGITFTQGIIEFNGRGDLFASID